MQFKRVDEAPKVWFRDDIRHILQGVADAADGVLNHVPETPEARAYRAGVVNTLAALAASFGLALKEQA